MTEWNVYHNEDIRRLRKKNNRNAENRAEWGWGGG